MWVFFDFRFLLGIAARAMLRVVSLIILHLQTLHTLALYIHNDTQT
ncbi:hypothetical protein RchiOBHm_Chr2g0141341 [Rosa chinensis]|uniref:Uncharacterized protein n=1 Tax=Rosa chinensis TaxID=74649 RepID=A0A2P6RXN4_ROSCH|nr:hypothetical protein RchiOBHm_Chr2g0141341 [Rosa chinensis]